MQSDFPVAYGCISLNDEIRAKSSSGGVFYYLAEYVLQNHGIVFAVTYNDVHEVVYSACEDIKDIGRFMGSKYVQSKSGDVFLRVKRELIKGRFVLFVGTPCQVEGLRCYLHKCYDNLILVDLACLGVPSPLVWKMYLNEISGDRKICRKGGINFRDKEKGWVDYQFKIRFENGEIYQKNHIEDLYLKGFIKGIYLRPSCYECKFKGVNRRVDFTLADFWGVDSIVKEFSDNKGVSLILIHNERAKMIFKSISGKMKTVNVSPEKAVMNNLTIIKSVNSNSKRKLFMKNFKKCGVLLTMKKCMEVSFSMKARNVLHKIMCKKGR